MYSGLMQPDSGEIIVSGNKILDLSEKELNEVRKKIGFLFQGAALYDSMNVKDNLEFPLIRNLISLQENGRKKLLKL
jgi:phospholipid/cholesterol/gamma-HCH transport system ATP-binding protein